MNAPRAARTSDARRITRLAGELEYPVDATAMAARLDGLIGDLRQCVRSTERDTWRAGSLPSDA